MKRVRRILFNALTAISLLLAIATAGLWVGSYWRICLISQSRQYGDARGIDDKTIPTYLVLHSGWVRGRCIVSGREEFDPPRASVLTGVVEKSDWLLPLFHLTSNGAGDFEAIFPGWMLSIPFTALPITFLLRKTMRRATPGQCPACGYDMRANPARCSECGREITEPKTGHE